VQHPKIWLTLANNGTSAELSDCVTYLFISSFIEIDSGVLKPLHWLLDFTLTIEVLSIEGSVVNLPCVRPHFSSLSNLYFSWGVDI